MGLLFANGGAKKKKTKKASKKAKTLTGQLSAPVDVRSQNSLGAFEDLLTKGPITIILIYADWCGACTRFKENTWNDITAIPPTQRKLNIASVREDMLPLTSIKNAKINGYPSLILVGKDKQPAEFLDEQGQPTNAMPNNEKDNILKILKTSYPNMPPTTALEPLNRNVLPEYNSNKNMVVPNVKNINAKNLLSSNVVVSNQSPMPPNMTADLSSAVDEAEVRTKQMGGSCSACQVPTMMRGGSRKQRKGGLLNALLSITEKGLPAAILVGLSSKVRHKKTRKNKK
jgi:hypothetical protein